MKRRSFFNTSWMIICLILFFTLANTVQVSALLPCDCKEDRILKFKEPVMKGEDVILLQKRLKELGFYEGSSDGRYDKKLKSSVIEFQQKNKLNPDGIVGVDTWHQLANGIQPVNKDESKDGPDGELSIIINTYKRTLTLYSDGEPYKTYPVAIGKPSTKTPIGEWAIIRKSKDWGGGFGTRWLGLNVPWGIYGIHGTNKPWSIGSAASHGCIRMFNRQVEELYEWVPTKTRVKIIGERIPVSVNKVLRPGQTGLSVMQLQDNLKEHGFEPSFMDARYGASTEKAVKELEAQFGIKVDGIADWNVLYILELPDD